MYLSVSFWMVVLGAALFVLGDGLVFQQVFAVVVGVAADIAHRHAGVFGLALDHLGQVAAAFFGQRRHRHADHVAIGGRVQAQVGVTDGFFHLGDHVFFPDLHADGARVDQGDVAHLIHRGGVAVVVHHHVIEQAGVGAAGAHLGQVGLEGVQGFLHLAFGLFFHVLDHGCQLRSVSVRMARADSMRRRADSS